jgi:hypothetical protein
VHRLAPGDSIVVGAEDIAYPQPLSRASPGDYQVMALLDADHNAAYTGMTSADLRRRVIKLAARTRRTRLRSNSGWRSG